MNKATLALKNLIYTDGPAPHLSTRFFTRLSLCFALVACATHSLWADVVYVTSEPQGCTSTTVCGNINNDGTYMEVNISLGVTSVKGSAPGRPVTPTASRAYLSGTTLTSTNAGVDIKPTLGFPTQVYQIDYNWNASAGNSSTDVTLAVTCSGGTLSFATTDLFRRSNGVATAWKFMGYLTNDGSTSTPTISFRYQSGTVNAGSQNRLLFDCWRFSLLSPCLGVPVPTPTGPIATNLTTISVTGITNTATAVTLYQNGGTGMTNIGSLTVSSPGGTVSVPVSGKLLKGAQVSATQTVDGQESCVQTTGAVVGGGANPTVRLCLSIRYDPNNTGPVGSAGTTAGNVYFLGASSLLSGSAPADAPTLSPANNWQTVTFTRGDQNSPTDPSIIWAGTGPGVLSGDFGALDGLALACQGDTGPFEIYLDDLRNGTNGLVQDWEQAAVGAGAYQFSQPSLSGTTSGNLLTAPNTSQVVTNTSAGGTNCLLVKFQFADGLTNRWLRLVTANNSGAVVNPTVDLNEPISLKVLLLPPGAVPPPPGSGYLPGAVSASLMGNNLVLNWSGTYPLQMATNLSGPFTDVAGVTNAPYTNVITGEAAFFRLRGN